ncbi:hypothetical protein [Janibacter indicus]|uniref:hypothetical protein n=1 Tax=Janibacter indicus TaxID=857417 RepID=UPI003EB9BEFF
MRRSPLAAGLAVAAMLVGGTASYAGLSSRPGSIAPEEVGVLACHVAWDARTRSPVLDRSQGGGCAGVTSAWVDDRGRITVRHAYNPVISIVVTPDEAAAGRGLTAGASGGGARTMLTVSDARVGRRLHLHTARDADRVGSGSGWWLVITQDAR